jgi:TRAP-type C4-dicarboxylate transport system permease small subunit
MPDAARRLPGRILAVVSRVERGMCVAAFVVVVGVLFADVVSRELTAAGLYWAPQVGVWANVIVVMAGFGLASAGGAHLRPRFADGWLPARWEPAVATLQHVVMALFCAAATALAARVVLESWRLGEVALDLFLPVWPIQLFIPVALGLATLRHGLYARYAELRPAETGLFEGSGPASQ